MRVDPDAVRRARQKAGLTLAQVAGTELTRQAVHAIETGKVRPRLQNLRVIARRLQVPLTSLLATSDPEGTLPDAHAVELERMCQRQQYAELARRAHELIEAESEDQTLAFASHYLGRALVHMNKPTEALPHLDRAKTLFESINDPWMVAEAMDWQAAALYLREDSRATAVAENALRLYRSLHPRQAETEARMLEHIGTFLVRQNDYIRARRYYEEALQVAGSVRDLARLARVYHGLSRCHWSIGDRERAGELGSRAVALYAIEDELRPTPAKSDLARVENDLANMLMQMGRMSHAEELVLSALERLTSARIERGRAAPMLSLAELRHGQDRGDEALQLCTAAIELAGRLDESLTLAVGHQLRGELHADQGRPEMADADFALALEILRRENVPEREGECLAAYQRILERRSGRLGGHQAIR